MVARNVKVEALRQETERRRVEASSMLASAGLPSIRHPSGGDVLPPREAAAMDWAEGDEALAARRLVEALRAHRGDLNEPTWWALFDIYAVQGQSTAFGKLAMLYAEHFKRSPPSWPESRQGRLVPPRLLVDTPPAEIQDDRWARFLNDARAAGIARLDLSRVPFREGGQGEDDAAMLARQMAAMRRRGVRVMLMGEPEVVDRGKRLIPSARFSRGWLLLLLEVAQWRGWGAAHAEWSMVYLERFLTSPPEFHDHEAMPSDLPVTRDDIVDRPVMEQVWSTFEHAGAAAVIDASDWRRMTRDAAEWWSMRLAERPPDSARQVVRHPSEILVALWDVVGVSMFVSIERRPRR